MSDTPVIATRSDMARFAREHYELVSTLACDYLSLMPGMIDEWEKFPEVLAAALSERERETVERCCADICPKCADGLGYCPYCYENGLCFHSRAEGHTDSEQCPAAPIRFAYEKRIRAEAARRETP